MYIEFLYDFTIACVYIASPLPVYILHHQYLCIEMNKTMYKSKESQTWWKTKNTVNTQEHVNIFQTSKTANKTNNMSKI